MNFTPKIVSGRVVKISSSVSPAGVVTGSRANRMCRPSDRPIQLRCIRRTFSGQRSSRSIALVRSSENCVILKNHCVRSRCSMGAPERHPRPSMTCSLASTVWSTGSQFTLDCLRSTKPAARKSRNIFC